MKSYPADGHIRAELIQHKGAMQVALRFPFSTSIRDHLKALEGVTWSQTHRCFYLLYTKENITRLLNHCRGVVWVDLGGLQQNNQPEQQHSKIITTKRQIPILHPTVVVQIHAIRAYMEQRRYAPVTIKNYINLLEVYCRSTECPDLSKLTRNEIEKYNHHLDIPKISPCLK